MKKIISFFGDQSDVFTALNERARVYAREKNLDYEWAPQIPFNQADVVHKLSNADAGIIDVEPYGEEIFSKIYHRAKILVRFGVGYDNVDLDVASKYGIAVARTTGANTSAVAEMALMLMLIARRRFVDCERIVSNGMWSKEVGHEIIGSTVGIVGFGSIGKRLAQLLKGFGVKILISDPKPNLEVIAEVGGELVSLETLFSKSDAISIHTPYMKETHHMINGSLLSLMKKDSVIVNTARGNIVDETALYEVLKAGRIAGAAFDVFAEEPLPMDSPLRTIPNMIITPHVSSQTVESLWNIYKTAIDIISDYFEGKGSPHILNDKS